MDNWAEISKDHNDFNSPDIDSTPDNNKKGEDDIDDAPVSVGVQTGQIKTFTTISLAVLVILFTLPNLIKTVYKAIRNMFLFAPGSNIINTIKKRFRRERMYVKC